MSGTLTDRYGTVMTVLAYICRLSVIKRHDDRYPHSGGVARLALFAGHGMCGRFIRSSTDAVVTPRAVTGLPRHGAVIKQNLQPIGGVMAHVAGLSGWYVSGTFADGNCAIVTTLA